MEALASVIKSPPARQDSFVGSSCADERALSEESLGEPTPESNLIKLDAFANFCKKLLAMGQYCLREIKDNVPFPAENEGLATKPKLKLIVNNR